MTRHIDANVIIDLLILRNEKKHENSIKLFELVEKEEITVQAIREVIPEIIYVLTSKDPRLPNFSRQELREKMLPLIKLPNFKIENKKILIEAIDIFATSNVKFVDAILIATMNQSEDKEIYSYDGTHFDNLPGIKRIEP